MKKATFILAAIMMVITVSAQKTQWNFDKSHTKISFTVTHMMITDVMGNFSKYSGTFLSDKSDFSDAKINFTIDANSINTDEPNRDKHLRSADFFNVEKYPEITFVGTSFKSLGNNMYKLTGDFTMNGVTKSITLDVKGAGIIKDPYGNTRTGFKLTGTIDRTLWGLKYNSVMDAGGLLIGNEISIACYVELIKQN